jgi:hypothetical protein
VQAAQDLLDALSQNPNDANVLRTLGTQAEEMAHLLDEYAQLRRILDRLAGVLGVSTP